MESFSKYDFKSKVKAVKILGRRLEVAVVTDYPMNYGEEVKYGIAMLNRPVGTNDYFSLEVFAPYVELPSAEGNFVSTQFLDKLECHIILGNSIRFFRYNDFFST